MSSDLLITVRKKCLGLNQTEFSEYLNKNIGITKRQFSQSTVSKYESDQCEVPAEVILLCRRIRASHKNEKTHRSISSVIDKVQKLHPVMDMELIRSLDVILDQRIELDQKG